MTEKIEAALGADGRTKCYALYVSGPLAEGEGYSVAPNGTIARHFNGIIEPIGQLTVRPDGTFWATPPI